jgi:hypothetical protein
VARHDALPWWLGPASRLNMLLLRAGLRIGSQHILTVPGRTSGRPRSTPVSLVTLDDVRYVVSGEGLAWVKNARAAGWAELFRAGRRERVGLTELPANQRGPILRAFWYQVPHGRPYIARFFGLAPVAGPDDFEAAAPRCPVFRIDVPAGELLAATRSSVVALRCRFGRDRSARRTTPTGGCQSPERGYRAGDRPRDLGE